MTDDLKALEVWLDDKMFSGGTRREFVQNMGITMENVVWLFCSGYMQGRQDKREENKNV